MTNIEFIERLVEELNELKDKINPTSSTPFIFKYNQSITDKETHINLEVTFGQAHLVSYRWYYLEYKAEDADRLEKAFITDLLKYMLFFKDSANGRFKSVQTYLKTIEFYGN